MTNLSIEQQKELRRAQLQSKLARKERLTSDPNPADVGRANVRSIGDKVNVSSKPEKRGEPVRGQGRRDNRNGGGG